MPSVVKYQSQLRVPPMPWMTLLRWSSKGNFRPELRMAELLPAAGLPMITYQGSSYSAALPLSTPMREDLIAFTASSIRSRSASVSARAAGCADSTARAASSSTISSSFFAARRPRIRRTSQTAPHTIAISTMAAIAQTPTVAMGPSLPKITSAAAETIPTAASTR